jgi:hypothetical protein
LKVRLQQVPTSWVDARMDPLSAKMRTASKSNSSINILRGSLDRSQSLNLEKKVKVVPFPSLPFSEGRKEGRIVYSRYVVPSFRG